MALTNAGDLQDLLPLLHGVAALLKEAGYTQAATPAADDLDDEGDRRVWVDWLQDCVRQGSTPAVVGLVTFVMGALTGAAG